MSKDSELEQEARTALLQHYSSKSSNQATNALTVALAFFTFIESIETSSHFFRSWTPIFLFLAFGLFVSLSFHIIYRALYYGKLADYAQTADFVTPEYLQLEEQKSVKEILGNENNKNKTILEKYYNERKSEGLPIEHDFKSASFNIRRLSSGVKIQIDRDKRLEKSKWRRFLLFIDETDFWFPAFSVYMILWACIVEFWSISFSLSLPTLGVVILIFGFIFLIYWLLHQGKPILSYLRNLITRTLR
jgi:hypothetical protein